MESKQGKVFENADFILTYADLNDRNKSTTEPVTLTVGEVEVTDPYYVDKALYQYAYEEFRNGNDEINGTVYMTVNDLYNAYLMEGVYKE